MVVRRHFLSTRSRVHRYFLSSGFTDWSAEKQKSRVKKSNDGAEGSCLANGGSKSSGHFVHTLGTVTYLSKAHSSPLYIIVTYRHTMFGYLALDILCSISS
eukprot:TRINITY_DN5818_c0_g1_i2.p1 TRINITY_DN5818_c0_g1~~TRINITY_DN5818_c0_g1_i2.p1  ORF type:complete len:101 (-),score=0.83 TRINITY_DN5818_c0_g1_i2:117-419(-)